MEIMDKNFKATDYYAVNKTHKIKKSRRSLIIFTNMSDSIDCWNNFGYDSGLIFWKRKKKRKAKLMRSKNSIIAFLQNALHITKVNI